MEPTLWKKPDLFITLPTGETKKISNLSDTTDQEEAIEQQDNAVDPEDDAPDFLYDSIMPS